MISKLKINNTDNYRYTFHYINDNEITYLCMSEITNEQLAFSFLNDIKKKFIQNYDYDKIVSFQAYQLNEFVQVLKQFMVFSLNLFVELLQY